MSQLHHIAQSISRAVNTHWSGFLGTFVVDKCNRYLRSLSCENIVWSEISMEIATAMQSGYFSAELAQDRAAQRHIGLMRRIHPSRQHPAGRLAHDDHLAAGVATLTNEENVGHSEIVRAKSFRDS